MTRDEFMNLVYKELHSDGDNYRANRIIDAADYYAEDYAEKNKPHWIPVTERLPDNSRNVLITYRGGVSMAWHNGLYFDKGANTHHQKIKTVTAWCELPEPYQKGDVE